MADLKISQLTSAALPLAGTEVLPIVQSSTTRKVATDDLTVKNVRSNATTGILQIAGPGAGTTRTMTTPNANFTVARTDAAQTFTGNQRVDSGNISLSAAASPWQTDSRAVDIGSYTGVSNVLGFQAVIANNAYYDSGYKYKVGGYQASAFVQASGGFQWQSTSVAGGSAGAAITFTEVMGVSTTGDLTISGSTATKASGTTWANPSDKRLKDKIVDYTFGLSTLTKINVKSWTYNGKGGTTPGLKSVGVIADEIIDVLPNSVDTYRMKLNESDEVETEIKRFDASEVMWVLVNSVKELKFQLDSALTRLSKLEN